MSFVFYIVSSFLFAKERVVLVWLQLVHLLSRDDVFMMEQTSHGHVRQPATANVDRHASHRRHLRWRRRWIQRQQRCPLRARVPDAVRRTEGRQRQLLQRWRQWLRLCRGPAVPAARVDDDNDGDWWSRTTNVLIRTSKPPTNCHNNRLSSRIPARWDVARWCRFTNNAPYVVASGRAARTCYDLAYEERSISRLHDTIACLSLRTECPVCYGRTWTVDANCSIYYSVSQTAIEKFDLVVIWRSV